MSPNVIGNPLTAVTATIFFDGTRVGELQDIVVEEDYAIKPIEQIGSSFVMEFLPGTVTGRMSAKRALLEGDLFFDKLTPAINASEGLTQLVSNVSNGRFTFNPQDLQNLEGLNSLVTAIFSGKTPRDRLTFVVYFDIELVNANGDVFTKLTDCMIKTRNMSISLGHVVLMQDLTILFKKRLI